MTQIGFIGLGNMGGGLAGSLCKAGYQLTVFDVAGDKVVGLVTRGARGATNVAEAAAGADIVITVLPASAQVREVVLGPAGVLAALAPGALLIDMSTIDPATTDELAETANAAGMSFIDAPLGRGPEQAAAGQALIMVGAADRDFETARPLFDAMADTIIRCGPVGSGIRTKLVTNFIGMSIYQVDAEALALAAAFGLDIDNTLAVITGSIATNGALARYWPTKVLIGDTEPGFAIDLALKDIGLAIAAAEQAGVPMVVGNAAKSCYEAASKDLGLGARDVSAMLEAQCQRSGVTTPRIKTAPS